MSDFFSSDIVRENLQEIFDIYRELSESQFWLPKMTKEERTEHIERTKGLIEKQKLFYFRLKLAANEGDTEAENMKDKINAMVKTFGYKDLLHCLDSLIETLERVQYKG